MPAKRLGRQTVRLSNPVSVVSYASIGGKLEAQGPLAGYFDELSTDSFFGCKTWEKGEAAMQRRALERALQKGGLSPEDLDYILAGDLLNQCIGTSFSLRGFRTSRSTGSTARAPRWREGLSLGEPAHGRGLCASLPPRRPARTSAPPSASTACPLAYGGQRTPTAQWTATAAGCVHPRCREGDGPVYHARHLSERSWTWASSDANNMGAAMAPAALRHASPPSCATRARMPPATMT